ncbi:MAG: DEAD/DEAH box helicase family protein, partial [Clostridia bacterium]|nr:DEAD/DEAH box helicase family protein [Clostridia bacterium]
MSYFESTAKYKLIYIFSINDEAHKGLLKVGEATISTTLDLGVLVPNCNPLNQAAKDRIKGYTATAGISYKLEHTELALREVKYGGGTVLAGFSDKDVHAVLSNSGKRQIKPNGTSGNEWFEVDLATAKNAIKAVKEGRKFLSSAEKVVKSSPISFREEQEDAITKTLECFKKQNEMLWYAKMRFGKTLTSLEVVRRAEFRRVIIVTHRPVVGSGWREEFNLIFRAGEDKHNYTFLVKDTSGASYDYDEKIDQSNELNLRNYDKNGNYFVYFASIQDLRGSKRVGGTFNKNNAVFDMDWDLIIIDEAHEGTQTFLGDNVIKAIRKDKTKVLALSGTPFNILDQYDENAVYTWDYVMEQKRKAEWDTLHPGDHNPYAYLPKMHIYTYELGDNIPGYVEHELEGKAFNFREFFRTWTGDKDYDKTEIPYGISVGDFRHKEDVQSFLNLITTPNSESLYPYSTKEYRNMFKHTLWMVPGVKEAKALSKMLREHPVFCHFGIANVAGEGDEYEESHYDDALELVRKTIKENDYSITLSCGKLTTGVTVKEWTAVFMLAGSYSTAAAGYMQTIFRVQSAGQIDGKQKTDCYVFDFAPDRTLKVLAETANISRKAGKAGKRQGENRDVMSDFLNFCPVIAIQGTEMKPYSVNTMMEQLKRVYAEKAIKNGFDDASIYNDNLMRLDDLELEKFKTLKGIVGASKAAPPLNDVEINAQGFSEEEYEKAEKAAKKPKKERTPEELELLKQREEQRKNRNNAISILRGVSIRMPLLIYGANVALTEDISVERFVTMVDDTSWEEFMPNGVTKDIFADFLKYYDRDVFISAGKEIRKLAASADVLTPTERVMAVVKIFDYFKNPDKETVLTPWRVVNMHMSDCLGGWCFYDEKFENKLDEPRFVDRGQVTKDTFANPNAQILEINSKSGLYPLYVAYSIYRAKLGEKSESDYSVEELNNIWNSVVRDNVFVICKTPMAKSITTRTLLGY